MGQLFNGPHDQRRQDRRLTPPGAGNRPHNTQRHSMNIPDLLRFALDLVTYATVTGLLPICFLAFVAWRGLRK